MYYLFAKFVTVLKNDINRIDINGLSVSICAEISNSDVLKSPVKQLSKQHFLAVALLKNSSILSEIKKIKQQKWLIFLYL